VKPLKFATLLLLLGIGAEAILGSLAFAADHSVMPGPGTPTITAERVAFMLGRLRIPTVTATIQTGGSCTTSCGPGPEGSCSKSCSGSHSCSASCSGGKAICSCD
jgi:hypothetical protein